MNKWLFFLFMYICPLATQEAMAEEHGDTLQQKEIDANSPVIADSVTDSNIVEKPKRDFFHKVGDVFTKFFKEFNNVDTNYIEPQRYNYTVMLQNTNTYEQYRLSGKNGESVTFAPDITYRLGPYVGWRWVFLGYTIDLKNIGGSNSSKKEFDLSLYSSLLGVDFFWRKTGNDYKIRKVKLGEGIDTSPMDGLSFSGIESTIRGINLYYIFNHRKFSYPAAYSQSTVQRRSAGSPLAGIGYTRHSLKVDWDQLGALTEERLGPEAATALRENLNFEKVEYIDISVSGGYSYNWVFAKNWLMNASLSGALGYKRSKSEAHDDDYPLKDFNLKNFNLDAIGRFAVVWNNTKWYAGLSAIMHSYNYSKPQFSTNNFFGNINLYFGVNIGRKR